MNQIHSDISADVVVVGAGPAGIGAALAAARNGCSTILIERFGCVGGAATVGLVGPFMTSYDTEGKEQIVGGIFDELVRKMEAVGGAIHPSKVPGGIDHVSFIKQAHHNCTPFDSEVLKYIAMEMLLDAGVTLRFHSTFCDLEKHNGFIESVVATDVSGQSKISGKVFIDATGDASLSYRAGDAFEKGRPADGKMQPATLFMRIGNVDDQKIRNWATENIKRPEDRLFRDLVTQAKKDGILPQSMQREVIGMYRQIRKGEWRVNTTRVLGVDGTDPASLTMGEIEGRRQAWALMNFFRKYCPGMKDCYLIDTAQQIGIRETRRIKGSYMVTRDDVQNGRKFDDAIVRYSFYLDIHNPSGGGQEKSSSLFIEKGRWFEIPYRALLPSDTANLLVAGRCISADHEAHGATRIMPACFGTGQAAGTAATISAKNNKIPSDIDTQKLREKLIQDGCFL